MIISKKESKELLKAVIDNDFISAKDKIENGANINIAIGDFPYLESLDSVIGTVHRPSSFVAGTTILTVASYNDNKELVNYLIDNGANIWKRNSMKDNFLDLAIENKKYSHIKLVARKAYDDTNKNEFLKIKNYIIKNNNNVLILVNMLENIEKVTDKTESKEAWDLVGSSYLVHTRVSKILDLEIAEIFNFNSSEKSTRTENTKKNTVTETQPVSFKLLEEKHIHKAFGIFKGKGGKVNIK